MGDRVSYRTFTDEGTGDEFILVRKGFRNRLWNKSELSGPDLQEEINDWLSSEQDLMPGITEYWYEETYYDD